MKKVREDYTMMTSTQINVLLKAGYALIDTKSDGTRLILVLKKDNHTTTVNVTTY